jgi:hypothetical protein
MTMRVNSPRRSFMETSTEVSIASEMIQCDLGHTCVPLPLVGVSKPEAVFNE